MIFGRFDKETKQKMVSQEEAIKGREQAIRISSQHAVNGQDLSLLVTDDANNHLQKAMFGLGCFWGAEKKFWQAPGVVVTAVGYAGGYTKNPSYEEVCSGMTGHNEVVLMCFDSAQIGYEKLLDIFWDSHNPTQYMAQGNDIGTQYRSGIYTFSDEQQSLAKQTQQAYQEKLTAAGYDEIQTELLKAPVFYFAEDYHQQYLAKNPNGYCGLGGLNV